MARRWVVSDGSNAQEVQADAAKVAVGGVVKPIKIACVAEGGVVRQFYPPASAASGADPRISWNTTALTVSQSAVDPLDATASITFNRSLGQYSYTTYPTGNASGSFLNPPLDGTAGDDTKYLIKVDQVSGATITGTLATWIDLNSAATLTWSLAETAVGSVTALANISIAQDDGFGSPAGGTTVVKAVTFLAEVTSISKIVWNTVQADLVEITEGVNADCILTFNPAGNATGSADTSGSFNVRWHTDTPALVDPSLFSVKTTLVSGDTPTGSALGTALSLDAVREWTLLATAGENLSCTLDVEVDTLPTSAPVVKRVTMNSNRAAVSTSNAWTTAQWQIEDEDIAGAGATITLGTDGVATGDADNAISPPFTENWNSAAPTPTDQALHEVRLTPVSGIAGSITGSAINTWLPLSSEVSWRVSIVPPLPRVVLSYVWDVEVRRIGDLSVTKRIYIDLGTEENP
jgi:hypothetical protein